MNPVLPLQILAVFCLALPLVPGSLKLHFLKYILEPTPCKLEPENCTQRCASQEDCQKGFRCCSSFCGLVCSLGTFQKPNRSKCNHSEVIKPDN
ncbi:WAP four-disulfide core domain protein 13 [Saimiri boliviensis]|uniref:WAP four-disulfide core domain 13 n=1 Tax=Saimiri boliviensis boliviensis TaxID=39432 RepID=A0A2K6TQY4_SAIBB|nr:WAP four-disulfide core domain protein 13 [Saimiri boliviensis boliviensis]